MSYTVSLSVKNRDKVQVDTARVNDDGDTIVRRAVCII
jgi:hypothetical protein